MTVLVTILLNWHREEINTWEDLAHEVGHLMGFYDEYRGGAIDNTPDTRWRESAPHSIMGGGTDVYSYHMEEFGAWFSNRSGEPFNLIER